MTEQSQIEDRKSKIENRKSKILFPLIIVLAAAAVYLPGLHAPFIYDDQFSIVENPSIRRLWPPRTWAAAPPTSPTHARPLANLSLAVSYRLGGLDPIAYHAINILLHAISAVLLFDLVRRTLMTQRLGYAPRRATSLAAAAALIWAVHPLNSDAVQYVTQRTELLVGLFYLATLWCACGYWSGKRRAAWLVAAGACCAAGMLSKQVMASAPLVVLLYHRAFLAGSFRRAWRSAWPLYAVLAGTWLPLMYLNAANPYREAAGFSAGVAATTWWMTQAKVFFLYLKLVVWPHPLLIHYAVPYVDTLAAALPWVAALLLLAAAAAAGLWKRRPEAFVGAWVLLILSPTMLVPIVTEVAAERRMYLPLAGIVALIVIGGHALARRAAGGAAIAAVVALVAAATLGAVSARRVAAYRDPIALWRQVLDQGWADARAHNNFGFVLAGAGRHPEAIAEYQRAIRADPGNALAHSNLGYSLVKLGQIDEGIAAYRAALRADPNFAEAHFNLGVRLMHRGRNDEAIAHLRAALRSRPDHVEANVNLGAALLGDGRTAAAIEHLRHALRLEPDLPEARNNLGVALAQDRRWADAVEQYRLAVQRDPTFTQAWVNLAAAYAQLDRMAEATAATKRALTLARAAGDAALVERLERLVGSDE